MCAQKSRAEKTHFFPPFPLSPFPDRPLEKEEENAPERREGKGGEIWPAKEEVRILRKEEEEKKAEIGGWS